MQKHNDAIKTSGHSSLEKYTSNFIWKGSKGLCVRGSWRLNRTATYWPPLFWLSQPFFPILLGCSIGGLGAQPLWDMVLIPASSLQLIWTSCRRGYIIIWCPPTSCEHHNFALNSTPRQSRSSLISWYLWPNAPVIYIGAFLLLTARPESICNKIILLHKVKWFQVLPCITNNSIKNQSFVYS